LTRCDGHRFADKKHSPLKNLIVGQWAPRWRAISAFARAADLGLPEIHHVKTRKSGKPDLRCASEDGWNALVILALNPARRRATKNGPACAGPKVIGVEPYAYSYARRYSLRANGPDPPELRGAGGLRIPALDGRPGPEATVFWVAFQLGTRLSAIGQHYESINEFVMAAVTVSHLRGGAGAPPISIMLPRSMLPLADACVWRDHCRHGPVMEGGAA
jgi:hypothetical protein